MVVLGFVAFVARRYWLAEQRKPKCGLLEGKVIGIWRGRVDLENGIGWSETCFDSQPLLHRSRLPPDPITTITWQTLCKHVKRDITNKYIHQKYYSTWLDIVSFVATLKIPLGVVTPRKASYSPSLGVGVALHTPMVDGYDIVQPCGGMKNYAYGGWYSPWSCYEG